MLRTNSIMLGMSLTLVGVLAACSGDVLNPTAPVARDVQADATAPSVVPLRVGLGRPGPGRRYVILAGNTVTNAKGHRRQADIREVAFLRGIAAAQPMIDRIDAWFVAYEKAHPSTIMTAASGAAATKVASGATTTMVPSAPLFIYNYDLGYDPCITAGNALYTATHDYIDAKNMYDAAEQRAEDCIAYEVYVPNCMPAIFLAGAAANAAQFRLDVMLDAANSFLYFGCMIG